MTNRDSKQMSSNPVSSEKARVTPSEEPPARRLEAACRWLVFAGFSFILVFGPVYYGAVLEWQVSVLAIVSLLILVFWAVSNLAAGKGEPGGGYGRVPLVLCGLALAFIALVILQTVSFPESVLKFFSPVRDSLNKLAGIEGGSPVSIAPHTTELWLFRTVACVIVFIVGAHAFSSRRRALYMVAVIVTLGYVLSVYGLLQYLSGYTLPALFEREADPGRAAGTYVNANHFAGYLEMCTPLALAIAFLGKRRTADSGLPLSRRMIDFFSEKLQDKRFLLPLTAVVVMSLGIIFSMSRMGIFSFAVSLVVFALLLGGRHRKKLRAVILGSVVAVILTVSLYLGLDPVMERYSLLAGGAIKRVEAWKMTGGVIADYPVLGTGLGTFTHVSPGYQTLLLKRGHWAESHNDYLNLMSDTGVAGFVIGMGFLLAWYVYVLRRISKRHLRTYQKNIAAGCVAGVSAMVVHSIADFNLQIPANAFYFATLLGLAIAVLRIKDFPAAERSQSRGEDDKARRTESSSGRQAVLKKSAILAAALLLAVILTPFIVRATLAQSWLEHAGTPGDSESRVQALKKSISLDQGNPEPHYQLGKIDYRDKEDYETARERFMKAVRLSPATGKYHFRLGMAYARLGNNELSERELSLAKRFAPMHADLHYKIGFYHFFRWRRTGDAKSLAGATGEFRKAAHISFEHQGMALDLVAEYLPRYEYLRDMVPDTAWHRRSFAHYLAGKGRWGEALAEYREAWRLELKEDESYRGDESLCLASARSHLMAGNVEDAKRGYLKALDFTTYRRRVFDVVRYDFTHAKMLQEGLNLLRQMKTRFPEDESLDMEIAKSHHGLGDYDTAERLFLKLSEVRPSAEIYCWLFDTAMRRGDWSLAEVYAGSAIRLNPSEAGHYAMLARAREANGDYEGAARLVKRALAIEPENEAYEKQLERLTERIIFEKK